MGLLECAGPFALKIPVRTKLVEGPAAGDTENGGIGVSEIGVTVKLGSESIYFHNHQSFACIAMRTDIPASTVPINQRCAINHWGLSVKNRAIAPAASMMRPLPMKLMKI